MRYLSFMLLACTMLVMATSGCVIRTKTVEVDRVDQAIEGNRGIIMGNVPAPEVSETKKTRTMYDIEVELPSLYQPSKKEKSLDKDLYGNRGYIQGSMAPEKEEVVPKKKSSTLRFGGFGQSNIPAVVYSEPVKKDAGIETVTAAGDYYIVEKGDTLQKISEKFYGTTKKWKKIYNANKDTLKNPDRIRAGQKLVIPKE